MFTKKKLLLLHYYYFKTVGKKIKNSVNKKELTTIPNCSGSDKLLYSLLNLDNAFNCSCSGRCFIKFYQKKRKEACKSQILHCFYNCI